MENPAKPERLPALVVWWIVWAAILSGLIVANIFLGPRANAPHGTVHIAGYLCLAPLAFSSLVRWAVLPRVPGPFSAFQSFIFGLATAEGAGLLGLLLGGERRTLFFVLGVLGVLQWAPFFARRFYPRPPENAHGLRSP